ncbi:MAG: PhzF family phenazine biosynthesis protein [Gammaproteobacteria bacterium]
MLKKMYQVDAFTDELFKGNPAAVFYLEEFFPEHLMQSLAAENNLAETAFVVSRGQYFDLRWFTPTHEAPFCGHATLATAHTLISEYGLSGPLEFHTVKVGKLKVTAKNDGFYELDIPRLEPQPCDLDLSDVLGVKPKYVFRNFENVFAVLDSSRHVRNFIPDLRLIEQVNAGGVAITAAGDEPAEADFVSRYFAPQGGIPEDPVTGSTHASLVPYWAGQFQKNEMVAEQCSARGGLLQCTLTDERVFLGGKAITYMEATVRLPSLFDM